jgi:hypothetical protein
MLRTIEVADAIVMVKDRIRRAEEGGEREPIKILRRNSAYVPNLTQHTSLLTRSRPHSYRQAISPRNRARNLESNWKHNPMQANPKGQPKLDQLGFHSLTCISLNTFQAQPRNHHGSIARTSEKSSLGTGGSRARPASTDALQTKSRTGTLKLEQQQKPKMKIDAVENEWQNWSQ